MTDRIYRDRRAAGQALGERLKHLELEGDRLVLGLPRGGVPVACEVAAKLGAPVDVLVVRKLGAPFNHELALGAVALGGAAIYNDALLATLGLDRVDLEPVLERELKELRRRELAYRQGAPIPRLARKTVVIVDDGMATGATMHAAVAAVRAQNPASIVVAVPTAAREAVERLQAVADRVVALEQPEPYYGVGAWYADFAQVRDDEVVAALADMHGRVALGPVRP
jgi:putative phosphoribosyl transferase